tara:strand:+ start:4132 stop:4374 length:243 start_codon:yes stop_codon:yes gene_type:complete
MTDKGIIISMIIVIALSGFFALKILALHNDVRTAEEQVTKLELEIQEQHLINEEFKKLFDKIEVRYKLSLRTVDDRRSGI